MKKVMYVFTAVSLMLAGASFVGCNTNTPAEKVTNAQKDVNEANKDLDAANKAYLADIENYKKETSEKIMANDKAIADFKARIETEKKDAKANYLKQVADLEQKNSDMKKKMDDYKADNKEKWEIFKQEFNHDMDELGAAFKGLTIKNVKTK
jgi:chromosome segregation ATPase